MKTPPQGSLGPGKLYVSNLSHGATLSSMRVLFGTCGDVVDVAFAAERGARSSSSAAYITMATSLAADRALNHLHGRLHGDRVLMISRVSADPAPSPEAGRGGRQPKSEASVAMMQQYRDRRASTYELSCSGKQLTLRFIFPLDDAQAWQVEARLLPGPPSTVMGSAMTREQAFGEMVAAWRNADSEPAASDVEWEKVATALRAVRAL